MNKFWMRLASSMEKGKETEFERQSRRVWLQNFGAVAATSAVLWACGNDETKAKDKTSSKDNNSGGGKTIVQADPAGDAAIVKVAMGLEYEAIALYSAAAGLDIWKSDTDKVVLAIAASFLDHHKSHLKTLEGGLDALIAKDSSITKATKKGDNEYVQAAVQAGADLSNVAGVLRLAAAKEAAAAQAYVGVTRKFTDEALGNFSGEHGGDEAGHYGVLRAALLALYSDKTIASPDKVIPASTLAGFTQKLS